MFEAGVSCCPPTTLPTSQAMSLPQDVEAGLRARELRCASPHSSYSKRTVALLSGQSEACKEDFLYVLVFWGLPNLVRCALEAGISPSCGEIRSRSSGALSRPALVQAALDGNARILKQLLEAGADSCLTDTQRGIHGAPLSGSGWPSGLHQAAAGCWRRCKHL